MKLPVEEILEKAFNQAVLDELMAEKQAPIDEKVLAEAKEKSKGNPWDAAILYDLIIIARKQP